MNPIQKPMTCIEGLESTQVAYKATALWQH
jgi:hypothetical protein